MSVDASTHADRPSGLRAPTAEPGAAPASITGWTREDWAALADRMLAAVRPYASPRHARVTLPGAPGGYGTAVDGLEGFARTFLLAGFRLAGERGRDPDGLAEWYAAGLDAGTDPALPERWPRPSESHQAKVEAASVALILDLTRPWLWDRLPDRVRQRLVDYLADVVGDDRYPRCNWVWFRIVVETFLRSVGGPWQPEDVEADLAAHDDFYRGGGWYADGDERAFDHYVGWALHLYPTLWARMRGASELADRGEVDARRLDRFLTDYVRLLGADGSPLIQGRSLVYRFAAAAPLWAGALAGVPGAPPGQLRRAASGILGHFTRHGVPDGRGLLTLGWHQEWRPLAQTYSGPSSPYWAAKGMLGLALPADHPVWQAAEEPLPGETGDQTWVARAPGWLVSGTRSDGVVRVVNHGTDHAAAGSRVGDSPLYARLGYSTATAPLLSAAAWESPADQSVVLLDAEGRATHRAGMRTLRADLIGEGESAAAVGASVARAHWLGPHRPAPRDHGSGREGTATDAAALTTVSVLRGAWEVRCVRVDPLPDAPEQGVAAVRLRVGGWPLAAAGRDALATSPPSPAAGPPSVRVRSGTLTSAVVALEGFDRVDVHAEQDASPLGAFTATPRATGPVTPGRWCVLALALAASPSTGRRLRDSYAEGGRSIGTAPGADLPAPRVTLEDSGVGAARVRIDWPDGERTTTDLPLETDIHRAAGVLQSTGVLESTEPSGEAADGRSAETEHDPPTRSAQ